MRRSKREYFEAPSQVTGVSVRIYAEWGLAFSDCILEAGVTVKNNTKLVVTAELEACSVDERKLPGSFGFATVRSGDKQQSMGGSFVTPERPKRISCTYRIAVY
ncbi:hypothetical protein FN976_26205 [Caenimonas sedimenti]|uniref:Uncharacterized protein n=1 Tax=Caenimonas sedimenti TaxID=2596921 RepID=A0A562ZGD0_9BURK|nr:hypothetical protein [Caenimonas sedimenti]TWO67028.1 hypothetical protein FN976_26205 [Caenimonas sedimenti]